MGFDRRFTLGMFANLVALILALAVVTAAFSAPGYAALRIVALVLTGGAIWSLWAHVTRTNVSLARFIEAIRFGDTAVRFESTEGAGFQKLGRALDEAMERVRDRQEAASGELRFLDALVDDMPVALLTIDEEGQITPANKAARRLFRDATGTQAADFATYGATFAKRLIQGGSSEELLMLAIDGRTQHAIVRVGTLERLGRRTRAVTVQPIQATIDAVEMATQTDLVRVLTHEILNSLTPVTSLAGTAANLLQHPDLSGDPRIADARMAVTTLARRAEGLGHFIEAYRAVARPPEVKRQAFAARPWAEELARLFAAEGQEVPLTLTIAPADLALDADPDLLAQVVINLLHNAAQAMEGKTEAPRIALRLEAAADGARIEVEDDGPGVPPSLRQDVFLPFFTTRAKGTGVGLNLARQIVVAHGGTIDIADGADGGALFRIRI